MPRQRKGLLAASMFVWASTYLGTLLLLLGLTGPFTLVDAFAEVREFRVMVLTLGSLFAAYATFGVLVLRYKATGIERVVLSLGPALLAILFTVELLMSARIPEPFERIGGRVVALNIVSTVCAWILALVAYRFVSRHNGAQAT